MCGTWYGTCRYFLGEYLELQLSIKSGISTALLTTHSLYSAFILHMKKIYSAALVVPIQNRAKLHNFHFDGLKNNHHEDSNTFLKSEEVQRQTLV